MGTPIASAIGAIDDIKLNWPGRLTAPMVVVAAAATPAINCHGSGFIPKQCAT